MKIIAKPGSGVSSGKCSNYHLLSDDTFVFDNFQHIGNDSHNFNKTSSTTSIENNRKKYKINNKIIKNNQLKVSI